MNYWWVNQKQTYRHEIGGGYMWSPKKQQDGKQHFSYEYMNLADNHDVDVCDKVFELIRVTEFPYVKPNSATDHFEKIIRDADMMQAFENN